MNMVEIENEVSHMYSKLQGEREAVLTDSHPDSA